MASAFICVRDPGRAGHRVGLSSVLRLGTMGSKVNSGFLFTLRDLRPLRFPVTSWCVCALVSVFVRTELQMGSLLVSLHSAFPEKTRILQSLIVGRFYQALYPSPDFPGHLHLSPPRETSFERKRIQGTPSMSQTHRDWLSNLIPFSSWSFTFTYVTLTFIKCKFRILLCPWCSAKSRGCNDGNIQRLLLGSWRWFSSKPHLRITWAHVKSID